MPARRTSRLQIDRFGGHHDRAGIRSRDVRRAGFEPESAELSMEPTTPVEISDPKTARQVLEFVERLEDLDDVQEVYANFDIPGELMEQLEEQIA